MMNQIMTSAFQSPFAIKHAVPMLMLVHDADSVTNAIAKRKAKTLKICRKPISSQITEPRLDAQSPNPPRKTQMRQTANNHSSKFAMDLKELTCSP
jgi:hypothetical protein